MDRQVKKRLQEIVGPDHVTWADEDLACYSYDGTALLYQPEVVVFPGCTEEVSAILRFANEVPFPVVPRGAGTGMTGGALPVKNGLVLAMTRFDRILEIDIQNQVAVVEPGVITGDFQREVERVGLFYPPDPASLKFCTLGGNIAECAGGPRAVKYGVTRDYVLGLEVVLADGRIMHTGVRTAKGVVGYDLTRLLVGSEGTLGVITKIVLRLLSLPRAKQTFLVLSQSLKQATQLVSEVLSSGLLPCTLEYLDRTALRLVAPRIPFALPQQTEAMLLIEVDGDAEGVKAEARRLADFLGRQPGVLEVRQAASAEEVEALWVARRGVSPAAFSLKPHKMSEDVVVPRSRIPELVAFIEALAAEFNLIIFTFGHAGDGNIHVNCMLDRGNPQEVERALEAKRRLFRYVLDLSGTLSGEHGIGLTKADFLTMELDPASITVMKGIKRLFDPNDVLNPGKIFPD